MRPIESAWNGVVSIVMLVCWHLLTGRGKQKVHDLISAAMRIDSWRRRRRR